MNKLHALKPVNSEVFYGNTPVSDFLQNSVNLVGPMERIISSYVYVGVDAFDFIGSEAMTSVGIPMIITLFGKLLNIYFVPNKCKNSINHIYY